ncbi:MAG TPA: transporter [Noviherbaspirillum sp.]|nr:transporter [Noviherbaspirillum sp.]
MKKYPLLGFIAAALVLPAHAQQTESAPAGGASQGAPGTAAAREALKQQEGDADQTTLLKQTLTAVDKQYSLLKRGKLAATYDLSYTYIGQDKIDAKFSKDSGALTLFNIENDSSHTITNTLTVDYGLRDNLTGSISLPIMSKYSENPSFKGLSHSLGDIGLNVRFQPLEVHRGKPQLTLTGGIRLPTGRSPFKVDANQGVATGSGYTSFSGGVSLNHVIDPVALFGNISYTYNLPAKHLSQVRSDGSILKKVAPGNSFGFGFGFAYALSYDITTSFSVSESISSATKLTYADGTSSKTKIQTGGVMNFGLGVRLSPKTTVNVSAGIGLTADSPNFTLGLTLPLEF